MASKPPASAAEHPRLGAPALALAGALVFASGALSLAYELIWIRKATLVVGASGIALSTVLTAFFLGAALGGWILGRQLRGPRWPPLAVYGALEAAIGVFALAFPVLFGLLERVYGALYPFAAGSPAALLGLRFLLLAVLFIPPTFCMGGTLPVLLDGLVDRNRHSGARASFLYGLNVLGAVAGALLASYAAIPLLGMNRSSVAGGVANIALGAIAWVAFRRAPSRKNDQTKASPGAFFPAAAFTSGLLAIGYQGAWARYFSLVQVPTVHRNAVLIAVYLVALAGGGLLLAALLRGRRRPLALLAAALALAPVAALGTLDAWRAAELGYTVQGGTLSESGSLVAPSTMEIQPGTPGYWRFLSETADAVFCAPFFQTALVVFLPALLLGFGLPALLAAAARGTEGLRAAAGSIVFWNALGSAAGSFLAGYVLLPLVGLRWTFAALGLGSLALAAAAAVKDAKSVSDAARPARRGAGRAPPIPRVFAAVWTAALLCMASLAFLRGDPTRAALERTFGLGRDRTGAPPRLTDLVEGPVASAFVFEDAETLRLGSGNTSLGMAYKEAPSPQAIQGHLPCLFYPGEGTPADCLGICLGTGQSFGALLLHPVRTVDVVEISSEIVDLCRRRFGPYHHGLDGDPRLRIHLDDGRHFVERSAPGSYDLVALEPPPPTADGVGCLYSIEFYQAVARVLRPGGVLAQWLPLFEVTPLDTQGIVRTQAAVFPHTFIIKAAEEELLVLSYPERPRFSIAAITRRCETLRKERLVEGRRWNASCRHELATPEGVLALVLAGPEEVSRLPPGIVFRDDDQAISYSSGDRWILRRYKGPLLSNLAFAALPRTDFLRLADSFDPPLPPARCAELEAERAASLASYRVPDPALVASRRAAFEAESEPRERRRKALEIARLWNDALDKPQAFSWIERAVGADPATGSPEDLKAVRWIVADRIAVFEELTAARIAALRAQFSASPLVEAMREELERFRSREAARLSGYLFR